MAEPVVANGATLRRLERIEEKLDRIVEAMGDKAEEATLEILRQRVHDLTNKLQEVFLTGSMREARIGVLETRVEQLTNEYQRRVGREVTKKQLWAVAGTTVAAISAIGGLIANAFQPR